MHFLEVGDLLHVATLVACYAVTVNICECDTPALTAVLYKKQSIGNYGDTDN